jgi:hypothetical protein
MMLLMYMVAFASAASQQSDVVTILARGDIPAHNGGLVASWIEYEVRLSDGNTEKMYQLYWDSSLQVIPNAGDKCTVTFTIDTVEGFIEGVDHRPLQPKDDALVIEELSCK